MVGHRSCFDIVVVGAGPAGLLGGLALRECGFDVAVCGLLSTPADGSRDTRTAALLGPSITVLEKLGVWPPVAEKCGEIKAIRLIDMMGRLARAPEVMFDAGDVGAGRLGWNVPNGALLEALLERAGDGGDLELFLGETVKDVSFGDGDVSISLECGARLKAAAVIAADGQRSLVRESAGINVRSWRYPQAALTTMFAHGRRHQGISTEFHRPGGPFTVVPMRGKWSSLVWVDAVDQIEELAKLPDVALIRQIEEVLQGMLGTVQNLQPRRVFPLGGIVADRFAGGRAAIVGEAAHAFPPIGAQGLNLTFRDIAVLADCFRDTPSAGRNGDFCGALDQYHEARTRDVHARIWAVDSLNRSLTSVWPVVGLARGAALHAIGASSVLKRGLMQAGLAQTEALPSLMRD